MSDEEYKKKRPTLKEALSKTGKVLLKVIKVAGGVILLVGLIHGNPDAAVLYGAHKGLDQ